MQQEKTWEESEKDLIRIQCPRCKKWLHPRSIGRHNNSRAHKAKEPFKPMKPEDFIIKL